MTKFKLVVALLLVALGLGSVTFAGEREEKVKVFLLAGQSNMEGHGQLRSLDHLGEDPEHGTLLAKLKDEDGSWAVRDDVTIVWRANEKGSGPLTVGWGYREHEIGPELMFGTVMGERYEVPVLLIKVAWGGKDVFCDFRSPSAGAPTGDAAALLAKEREKGNEREVGFFYRQMVEEIRAGLERIEELVPGYAGEGYELAGMAWFQGWNDYCRWREGPEVIEEYSDTLAAMFRDLRKDLDAPTMPIVVGEMGIGGEGVAARAREGHAPSQQMMAFRRAQRAVAEESSLQHVTFVPTAHFWDERLEELSRRRDDHQQQKKRGEIVDPEDPDLPTKELGDEYRSRGGHWHCHYNGSAANYSLIGWALAEALGR